MSVAQISKPEPQKPEDIPSVGRQQGVECKSLRRVRRVFIGVVGSPRMAQSGST